MLIEWHTVTWPCPTFWNVLQTLNYKNNIIYICFTQHPFLESRIIFTLFLLSCVCTVNALLFPTMLRISGCINSSNVLSVPFFGRSHIFNYVKLVSTSHSNNRARLLAKSFSETFSWLSMTGWRCKLLQTSGLERYSEHKQTWCHAACVMLCPCLTPLCHILYTYRATKCHMS